MIRNITLLLRSALLLVHLRTFLWLIAKIVYFLYRVLCLKLCIFACKNLNRKGVKLRLHFINWRAWRVHIPRPSPAWSKDLASTNQTVEIVLSSNVWIGLVVAHRYSVTKTRKTAANWYLHASHPNNGTNNRFPDRVLVGSVQKIWIDLTSCLLRFKIKHSLQLNLCC